MKAIVLDSAKIVYRVINYFLRLIQNNINKNLACRLQNIFLMLQFSKLRFYYDKKKNLFLAKELDCTKYFGEMNRGFNIYGRSLKTRGKNLFNSYCLKNINFNSSDIVIDCGANYGDLFIELSKYIKETNYITFEPGPIEHKCLVINVAKSNNQNFGLSNTEGKMKFYLASDNGDSSLIEPNNYTDFTYVRVTTLDNFQKKNNLKKCKLLKLEAEGYEPEILQGANNFIKICEYITVDGGPERGIKKQITFPEINNYLLNNNFKLVDMNARLYRGLYKNCAI